MQFEEFISWLLSTRPASKLMTSENLRIRKFQDNGDSRTPRERMG